MHRLLRLKCLYELSDTSTFYYNFAVSNAQNFQKFLKPNRILSEEKKELYAVFIKFTLKLLRLKNKSARKRDNQKKKILSELEAPNFKSASKDWLVKKIKLL